MLCAYLGLVAVAALVDSQSLQVARRIPQELALRADFYGGYGLSSSACPSGTDKCGTYGCCPSGQACDFFLSLVFCCPDSNDCHKQVEALPVCADPSWVLFSDGYYTWCCPQGQIGIRGASEGICINSDVEVPASKKASTLSQIGGATNSQTGRAATPTSAGGSRTTARATVTATGIVSAGDPQDNPSNPSSSPSMKLSTGAVAGIVVGCVVAVALIIVSSWFCYRRGQRQALRKQLHLVEGSLSYNAVAVQPTLVQEHKDPVPPPLQPEQQFRDHQYPSEIDSRSGAGGRAELEHR